MKVIPASKETECVLSGPLLYNECFHFSLTEALFEFLYHCSRRTVPYDDRKTSLYTASELQFCVF